MMEYEVFKEIVAERIKDFLPPIFKNSSVEIRKVAKYNLEKDTMFVMPEDMTSTVAAPNIYLDDAYEAFKQYEDLDQILRTMAAIIVQYTNWLPSEEYAVDFAQKKDLVVMNLINTEKNRKLLERLPHREVMDLSVVYRIIMRREGNGFGTILVDRHVMEAMGVSAQELDELARVNTKRLFPSEVLQMGELFFILTNMAKLHGAASMLYDEELQALAERFGGNFYLIPSSVHELIAVSEQCGDLQGLKRMLRMGNLREEEENILSSSVYRYDMAGGRLSVAA